MLDLRSVAKMYPHRSSTVVGLSSATFTVARGEFVSVVGPSGSGKSTLLLMMGGMLSPTEGAVLVDGHSVYGLSPARRAELRMEKIGFVFQTFNLVPYLNALENVQLPLVFAHRDAKAQCERAAALLERVGLGDRLDHKPSELSIGQQQRVALARMLANDPPLILADEPTGNLDPATGVQILDFLSELNAEGRTVVMVTHDPNAARRATRTLRLANGRVIQPGA